MGCDIHLYVERRNSGGWISCDTWEKDNDDNWLSVPYSKQFYNSRNYDLFAILANVRNGYGFAGVNTGDGFVPMAEPKGLPDDVTEEVREASDQWGVDGHSHSYFTVADLMTYDWTRTTKKHGIVSARIYQPWKRWGAKGRPKEYSGGIWGRDIKIVSNEEMDVYLEALADADKTPPERDVMYTEIEWQIAYYEAGRDLLGETLPQLWRFGEPDQVRIVFWFDN